MESSLGKPATPRSPHGHPTCPAVLASLLGVNIQSAVNWASHIAERASPPPGNTARSE
jgi:hypothetical protein